VKAEEDKAETCSADEEGIHCEHWLDDEPCCACGETRATKWKVHGREGNA
jgi:hypothetical protein